MFRIYVWIYCHAAMPKNSRTTHSWQGNIQFDGNFPWRNSKETCDLVGGLHPWNIFPYMGNFIISTDDFFFRGVAQPPTRFGFSVVLDSRFDPYLVTSIRSPRPLSFASAKMHSFGQAHRPWPGLWRWHNQSVETQYCGSTNAGNHPRIYRIFDGTYTRYKNGDDWGG